MNTLITTNDEEPKVPQRTPRAAPKPVASEQSYAASPDVQRWLEEQAITETIRPPFEPTLLAGMRDRDWLISSLAHFYHNGMIDDVLHVVKSGKEATVYCCAANPAMGVEHLAAKIYRPRMFRNLSNDAIYRENRTHYNENGKVIRGGGRGRRDTSKNQRGRAEQVTSWIAYEYQTQQLLYDAGGDVPRPIAQIGNGMLMAYIGDDVAAAPRLCDVRLAPEEAQPMFDLLMRNIELGLAKGRIHGDLSAFNILYWEGNATIIDFAQAVDPRRSHDVYTLLERDIERVYRYFVRYGIVADPSALATKLWVRYMGR